MSDTQILLLMGAGLSVGVPIGMAVGVWLVHYLEPLTAVARITLPDPWRT